MMQKPLFKLFIWIISVGFFLLASAMIISMFSPGPSQTQIMQFMSGMMGAMANSTMGLSMSIEEDSNLKSLIFSAASVTTPLVIAGILAAFFIKIRRS